MLPLLLAQTDSYYSVATLCFHCYSLKSAAITRSARTTTLYFDYYSLKSAAVPSTTNSYYSVGQVGNCPFHDYYSLKPAAVPSTTITRSNQQLFLQRLLLGASITHLLLRASILSISSIRHGPDYHSRSRKDSQS